MHSCVCFAYICVLWGATLAQKTQPSSDTSTTATSSATASSSSSCPLQFGSVQCSPTSKCGELNGFQLICVNLGQQDGEEKNQCDCSEADKAKCQNSTMQTGAVPQYGDCANSPCADSYGFVSSDDDSKICAEKLHCVTEVSSSATSSSICHTCRSCLLQNDKKGDKLVGVKRFDCKKICPESILKQLKVDQKEEKTTSEEADEISDKEKDKADTSAGYRLQPFGIALLLIVRMLWIS